VTPTRAPIAAVVSIGDELLEGDVADGNASWLGRELGLLGLRVAMMATLPDSRSSIARFVMWAQGEYDTVVVTGGLGGTPDDVTRDGIADAFGVERILDTVRADASRARGGHAAVLADEWCRLPVGSRVLAGADGGAPPFVIENVYVLPGVPAEMRAAFEGVRGELRKGPPRETWRCNYKTTEDEIASLLAQLQQQHPAVRIGSYPRGVHHDEVEIVVRTAERRVLDDAVAGLEAAFAERSIKAS
jgi:molybdenum cofactor synthesis domain-containing protein